MLARHAHLIPRVADNLCTILAVQFLGHVGGDIGELDEGALGRHAATAHRLPPDLAGLLPRIPTESDRSQIEGPVGDAAVQMHPAVVGRSGFVVGHIGRLRIFALFIVSLVVRFSNYGTHETRVVVSGAGLLHAPKSDTLDIREQTAFADEPVGLVSRLVLKLLLDHDAEHVRDVLVQGARLALVHEWARVLGDGVLVLSAD